MPISSIIAINFRNFETLQLEFSPQANLFFGQNGTGKTSILEILYFLSYGKSFRTHISKRLIKHEYDKFTLFSQIFSESNSNLSIGTEKSIQGDSIFKLAGTKVSLSDITNLLPIQILNNDSFLLLTDGPTERRQFIDWGVFHVKHSFLSTWRNYQRALKQRNIAIKNHASLSEVQNWNRALANSAQVLAELRQSYVDMFVETFLPILLPILPLKQLSIKYYQGWPADLQLIELLEQNIHKDLELGYTFYGAHRADLKITLQNKPIEDVLSRGQQKIFVWLMRLTQAFVLNAFTKKKPIILIDDVSAELDIVHLSALSNLLKQIDGQLFVTAIDKQDLDFISQGSNLYKMFHVEHEQVVRVS